LLLDNGKGKMENIYNLLLDNGKGKMENVGRSFVRTCYLTL